REQIRKTETDVHRHQATLGEAKQDRLLCGKAFLALSVEQLKEQLATALNAGLFLAPEIVPGVAAVIRVGRVHQQIIQPWQLQGRRQPTITGGAVAQAVQS